MIEHQGGAALKQTSCKSTVLGMRDPDPVEAGRRYEGSPGVADDTHQRRWIRSRRRHDDERVASRIGNRRKHRDETKAGSQKKNALVQAIMSDSVQLPSAPTIVALRATERRISIPALVAPQAGKKALILKLISCKLE
jgi:hypothetical protein